MFTETTEGRENREKETEWMQQIENIYKHGRY